MTTKARSFARRRILRLPIDVYAQAIRLLADAVAERLGPVEAVIGIATGGLPPARRLGQLLDTPMFRIDARHNPTDTAYTQATGQVSYNLAAMAIALAGRRLGGRVLLVDDICGSAATLDTVQPALADHLAPAATVHPVVLCRNLAADRHLDLWVWTVDDWVRFPWEPSLPPDGTPLEDLGLPDRVQPS